MVSYTLLRIYIKLKSEYWQRDHRQTKSTTKEGNRTQLYKPQQCRNIIEVNLTSPGIGHCHHFIIVAGIIKVYNLVCVNQSVILR